MVKVKSEIRVKTQAGLLAEMLNDFSPGSIDRAFLEVMSTCMFDLQVSMLAVLGYRLDSFDVAPDGLTQGVYFECGLPPGVGL